MRAQQVYDQSWARAKHLFPERVGAPPVRWLSAAERYPKPNPRAAMWVEFDGPEPTVYITPGQTTALASDNRGVRAAAQKRLLHEWRHMHQSHELLNAPDLSLREADASQFARQHAGLFRPRKPKVRITGSGAKRVSSVRVKRGR